jgi:hypothetical protein
VRNFWKKFRTLLKNALFFVQFFFHYIFRSTKNNLQNGHFNFSRRWPHIFYMLFEKSYDIFMGFLVETIWKYFENFLHFLFKNFRDDLLVFWFSLLFTLRSFRPIHPVFLYVDLNEHSTQHAFSNISKLGHFLSWLFINSIKTKTLISFRCIKSFSNQNK